MHMPYKPSRTHLVAGYSCDRCWHFMDLLAEAPAHVCRELEKMIIAATQAIPGCRNDKPGGEGVSADSVHRCYVYIVCAGAGQGVSLEVAYRMRIASRRQLAGQKNLCNVYCFVPISTLSLGS